jgi:site-specific DNA-methyltransferase (adenine-specific)
MKKTIFFICFASLALNVTHAQTKRIAYKSHSGNALNFKKSLAIAIFENEGSNFSDCEIAYQSFDRKTVKFKYRWNGMLQENMKQKEFRIHPTQKPVALYRWLLNNYAKPNDLILDTHVGSASSLIACEDMGFKYVGCELDKDYYEQSLDRLKKHTAQGKLFEPIKPKTKQEELLLYG